MIPEKFSITISQENIEDGNPGVSCLCPIALSVQKRFNCDVNIFTMGDCRINNMWYKHDGNDFIRRFDSGKKCEPTVVNFYLHSQDVLGLFLRHCKVV